MLRVVKSLGLGQKRKFTRMQESQNSTGIVGFDNLVAYIQGEKVLDVETGRVFDPRISGQWTTPDLMLVEEGDEFSHQMKHTYKNKEDDYSKKGNKIINAAKGSNKEIWEKKTVSTSSHYDTEKIGNFEILDSSIQGYGILWRERSLKVKIGELFGVLMDSGNRVEIGIIRTIRITSQDEIRMGIELIGMESKYVTMSMPGVDKASSWALLIPPVKGIQQQDSIIFASSDFHTGEFINIKEKRTITNCRLSKLLHSTPAISHVELFYPKM